MPPDISAVRRDLETAIHLLAGCDRLVPEQWLLVATLIAEADLSLRARHPVDQSLMPFLERAIDDLREVTRDFTDREFVRSTRAARRRNPTLFLQRR